MSMILSPTSRHTPPVYQPTIDIESPSKIDCLSGRMLHELRGSGTKVSLATPIGLSPKPFLLVLGFENLGILSNCTAEAPIRHNIQRAARNDL
jgi:hypothetical protein